MVKSLIRLNPLRMDPTRTATLRRKFESELVRRFNKLKAKLKHLLTIEDAFGLKFTVNGWVTIKGHHVLLGDVGSKSASSSIDKSQLTKTDLVDADKESASQDKNTYIEIENGQDFLNSWAKQSKFNKEEKELVHDYQTASGCSRIQNSARASEKQYLSKEENNELDQMDLIFTKSTLPQDTTLFRGISVSKSSDILNVKQGSSWEDSGYQSVTLSKKIGKEYAELAQRHQTSVLVVYKSPKGLPAIPVDGLGKSQNVQEVLLPRDLKGTVISNKLIDKIVHIEVQL